MAATAKRTKKEESNTTEEQERPEDLENKIAESAYYKAENRGFEPGHELEDWLEAEREFTV
ncbi:MAG: DUF2934 domain-containing protein [Methylobacter sp.]